MAYMYSATAFIFMHSYRRLYCIDIWQFLHMMAHDELIILPIGKNLHQGLTCMQIMFKHLSNCRKDRMWPLNIL